MARRWLRLVLDWHARWVARAWASGGPPGEKFISPPSRASARPGVPMGHHITSIQALNYRW